MNKLVFTVKRLVQAVCVLLMIVVLNFFLIRAAPGDPAQVMAGEAGAGDEIYVEQLREKFGLNRPLHEQLFLYVSGIVTLDLGYSYRQEQPVAKLIFERLAATLPAARTIRSRYFQHDAREAFKTEKAKVNE